MHRKIEIKERNKKMNGSEKHILTAKTLSKAAEVNKNLEKTEREVHEMMRKVCRSEYQKTSRE